MNEVAERRRITRLPAECNALIRLSASLTFRCQVRNISTESVQVCCETRYALLIHPRSEPLDPNAIRLLDLSIALPINGTVQGFSTRCRALYCEPYDSSLMLLGLKFIKLDPSAVHLLANFIGTLRDE